MTDLIQPAPPAAPARPTANPADQPGPFWRQPYFWMVVLTSLVIFNALYALPRYLTFNQDNTRVGLDPHHSGLHYLFVIAHVVTGNVAMLTLVLQMWPWLRRHHPEIHRISGRVYCLGGALPSALIGMTALLVLRQGQLGSTGLFVMASLWIITTVMGWIRARQYRWVAHQRWMVYSFALALATSWGRFVVLFLTAFPFAQHHLNRYVLVEVTNWLCFVVNLLVAHWWLESRAKRSSRGGTEVVSYPSPL